MATSLRDDIAGCRAAHARLPAALDGLGPGDARRASRLPGWTVGHVLTHLARNADSHARMLAAAVNGEVADQYHGGRDGRAADIEVGAGRPEAELVADVLGSCRALEAAWASTSDEVWERGRARLVGGECPVAELPFRRWREVELHHADLGMGYGWRDWPAAYVARDLEIMMARLAGRLPAGRGVQVAATDTGARWAVPGDGAPDVVEVAAPAGQLLAWLTGREGGSGFPPLTGWEG